MLSVFERGATLNDGLLGYDKAYKFQLGLHDFRRPFSICRWLMLCHSGHINPLHSSYSAHGFDVKTRSIVMIVHSDTSHSIALSSHLFVLSLRYCQSLALCTLFC